MFGRIPLSVKIAVLSSVILVSGSIAISVVTFSMVRNNELANLDQKLLDTAQGIAQGGLPMPNTNINPSLAQSEYYIRFVLANQNTVRVVLPGIDLSANVIRIYSPPQIDNLEHANRNEVFEVQSEPNFNAESILFSDPNYLPLIQANTRIEVRYVGWKVITINTSRLTDSEGTRIFLALPTDQVESLLNNLLTILLITCLTVLLFSVSLTSLMVRYCLKPLNRIRLTAETIASAQDDQSGIQNFINPSAPDNTEIGSLEKSLNQMLMKINASFERQRQAERQIRKFIADSSHELRTPLSIILGYSELFHRQKLKKPKQVGELMTKINTASQRMKILVDDLVYLTRLDEGEALNLRWVNPQEMLMETKDNLLALSPERPVSLIEEISAPPVRQIHIDPQRIHQVLTNLIGNINRYTDVEVPVELKLAQTPQTSQFSIIDHGPGIDPVHFSRLFERFYVVESSRSRESSGSGLGLAIVKTIIERHGGKIWADTTPGGGLSVHFSLPNTPESAIRVI
jgi:two-component system OmpR family sensor kinase